MQFVDKARIVIKAGNGGNGLASFHREKFVARGGPDGGDGGKGGSVVFYADPGMSTLLDFKFVQHYRAQAGEDGKARLSRGRDGEDLVIKVPVGTLVRDVQSGAIIVRPSIIFGPEDDFFNRFGAGISYRNKFIIKCG